MADFDAWRPSIDTLNQISGLLDRYEAANKDERDTYLREALHKSCAFFRELESEALTTQVERITTIEFPNRPDIRIQRVGTEEWQILQNLESSMRFFNIERQLLEKAGVDEPTRERMIRALRGARIPTQRYLHSKNSNVSRDLAQSIQKATENVCLVARREQQRFETKQRNRLIAKWLKAPFGVGVVAVNAYSDSLHLHFPPALLVLSTTMGTTLVVNSLK